jgi:hypothetical protein
VRVVHGPVRQQVLVWNMPPVGALLSAGRRRLPPAVRRERAPVSRLLLDLCSGLRHLRRTRRLGKPGRLLRREPVREQRLRQPRALWLLRVTFRAPSPYGGSERSVACCPHV